MTKSSSTSRVAFSSAIELGIVDYSPFETLDAPGIGQLVQMGGSLGPNTEHSPKLGGCGDHGGDPDSIAFFHAAGTDYLSCSPFRVPGARIAAAQAVTRGAIPGH